MELHPLEIELGSYQARWTEFGSVLSNIAARLAQLPPGTVWAIDSTNGGHIGQVTLADFAFKFANISWTLTDKDYSDLNGGVGEVVSRMKHGAWKSAHEEIRARDFDVYMQWQNEAGAVYLALHETAHVTELGLHVNAAAYDIYIARGGDRDLYPNSPEWTYNEAVANDIAKAVAGAIGLDCMPDPTGGLPSAILRGTQTA